MKVTDIEALAAENGWQRDPRTPRRMREQFSTIRNGFLAAVFVLATDDTVRWNVQHLTDEHRAQRGTAEDLPSAMGACDAAIQGATGTLF